MLEEPGCLVQLSAQPHKPFWLFNLVAAQAEQLTTAGS
jgi:hypothetical protein